MISRGGSAIQRNQNQPESLFERKIREAQDRGDFRNLSNNGKPLNLGRDPERDRESWAANRVLQNAGMLPAWIELAKEIDKLDDMLSTLVSEHTAWLDSTFLGLNTQRPGTRDARRPGVQALQRRYLGRALGMVNELRRKVERFNLIVPAAHLQKAPVVTVRRFENMRHGYRERAAALDWPDVDPPEPIPIPGSDPLAPMPLFDPILDLDLADVQHDHADSRERVLELNRRLARRRTKVGGIPLDWLAAINPFGHAADLLKRKKAEQALGLSDED